MRELHQQCCQFMIHETMPRESMAVRINSKGDRFFIILRGTVGVYLKAIFQDERKRLNQLVYDKTLGPGDSFGELALIHDENRRMASVQCLEDCDFAVLGKEDFQRIL